MNPFVQNMSSDSEQEDWYSRPLLPGVNVEAEIDSALIARGIDPNNMPPGQIRDDGRVLGSPINFDRPVQVRRGNQPTGWSSSDSPEESSSSEGDQAFFNSTDESAFFDSTGNAMPQGYQYGFAPQGTESITPSANTTGGRPPSPWEINDPGLLEYMRARRERDGYSPQLAINQNHHEDQLTLPRASNRRVHFSPVAAPFVPNSTFALGPMTGPFPESMAAGLPSRPPPAPVPTTLPRRPPDASSSGIMAGLPLRSLPAVVPTTLPPRPPPAPFPEYMAEPSFGQLPPYGAGPMPLASHGVMPGFSENPYSMPPGAGFQNSEISGNGPQGLIWPPPVDSLEAPHWPSNVPIPEFVPHAAFQNPEMPQQWNAPRGLTRPLPADTLAGPHLSSNIPSLQPSTMGVGAPLPPYANSSLGAPVSGQFLPMTSAPSYVAPPSPLPSWEPLHQMHRCLASLASQWPQDDSQGPFEVGNSPLNGELRSYLALRNQAIIMENRRRNGDLTIEDLQRLVGLLNEYYGAIVQRLDDVNVRIALYDQTHPVQREYRIVCTNIRNFVDGYIQLVEELIQNVQEASTTVMNPVLVFPPQYGHSNGHFIDPSLMPSSNYAARAEGSFSQTTSNGSNNGGALLPTDLLGDIPNASGDSQWSGEQEVPSADDGLSTRPQYSEVSSSLQHLPFESGAAGDISNTRLGLEPDSELEPDQHDGDSTQTNQDETTAMDVDIEMSTEKDKAHTLSDVESVTSDAETESSEEWEIHLSPQQPPLINRGDSVSPVRSVSLPLSLEAPLSLEIPLSLELSLEAPVLETPVLGTPVLEAPMSLESPSTNFDYRVAQQDAPEPLQPQTPTDITEPGGQVGQLVSGLKGLNMGTPSSLGPIVQLSPTLASGVLTRTHPGTAAECVSSLMDVDEQP